MYPLLLLMSKCPGKAIVNFGTWFCPSDKTLAKYTYCEYCVNNGCIDKTSVTQIKHTFIDYLLFRNKIKYIKCNCPNQLMHPVISAYLCPTCDLESDVCSTASSGHCKLCKIEIGLETYTYCCGCSYQICACLRCGQKIKDGNSYILDIKKIITERIVIISPDVLSWYKLIAVLR